MIVLFVWEHAKRQRKKNNKILSYEDGPRFVDSPYYFGIKTLTIRVIL